MSLTISKNYSAINMQNVAEDTKEIFACWSQNPVYVPAEKIARLQLLPLLNAQNTTNPSKKAKILSHESEELAHTALLIDSQYHEAIEKYKEMLIEAGNKDGEIIRLQQSLSNQKKPSCVILSLFGKSSPPPINPLLTSENRSKCLEEIEVREKIRLETAMITIQLRFQAITDEIRQVDPALVDLSLINELRQLDTLIKVFDPSKQLKINGVSCLEYIESIMATI